MSYLTLRDQAFAVTNGQITAAHRFEKGKNLRWEIHVEPAGDDRVTVILPMGRGCDADGAICTEDGRALANRLEVVVPGPGN